MSCTVVFCGFVVLFLVFLACNFVCVCVSVVARIHENDFVPRLLSRMKSVQFGHGCVLLKHSSGWIGVFVFGLPCPKSNNQLEQ